MTRFALPVGIAWLLGVAGCADREPQHLTLQPVALASSKTVARLDPTDETAIAPLIQRYCFDCHSGAVKRGGIALDSLTTTGASQETWSHVADVLRAGTMPPSGRPQPLPAERAALEQWLATEVLGCSATDADPGRVTIRRLNRAEYNNSIRDLLGLDLQLADSFPADDVGYGFDNIGDVLSMPPILLEKYLQAADLAVEAVARSPRAWANLVNPAPDLVPAIHRQFVPPIRTEPVKRIGLPVVTAPPARVEDPEVLALRHARDVLRAFADRAYRRPATADELTVLVGLVESARRDGDNPDEAIRHALKAVLISPNFLFLVEAEPAMVATGKIRPLDDFELAARLATFLWSSIPDDELFRLAAHGSLRADTNLTQQVRRMLRDQKVRALVDGFVSQWLQIRTLKDVTPDPQRFPDFDEPLRQAMLNETRCFAAALIQEDRSVLDFLDADYTFVNERLARHYGMPDVVGPQFRRIALRGGRRGGVLTHASVLTVTSNPTRTSPVKRGKWILDNLLGMPPPPPPAGVEGLKVEEDADQASTLRQKLEHHRADPNCASCHARMDPLGFGLENFDGIGAWRSSGQGGALDVSGTLPGGGAFENPAELRAVLMTRREAFVRCLAEKLLTYGLGRGTTQADRCFVDEIVRKAEHAEDRLSGLVLAIVASPPFQSRNPSQGLR